MDFSNNDAKKRIIRRTELRRKLICDAASRLFVEHGYSSTTLEMIAEEVGYSKTNFYNYFKNKEEVLALLVIELNEEVDKQVEESVKSDLPADVQLIIFGQIFLKIIYNHPVHSALIQTGRPFDFVKSYPEAISKQKSVNVLVKSIIQKGINDKSFDVPDINIAALTLLYSLRSVLRWYRPEGYLSLPQIADQITNIFLKGLMSPNQKCIEQTDLNSKHPLILS